MNADDDVSDLLSGFENENPNAGVVDALTLLVGVKLVDNGVNPVNFDASFDVVTELRLSDIVDGFDSLSF